MTERMAKADDRLEAGYRELKRFGKTQSRWWKQRYNRAISQESEIKGVERGLTRLKEMYGERISFPQ